MMCIVKSAIQINVKWIECCIIDICYADVGQNGSSSSSDLLSAHDSRWVSLTFTLETLMFYLRPHERLICTFFCPVLTYFSLKQEVCVERQTLVPFRNVQFFFYYLLVSVTWFRGRDFLIVQSIWLDKNHFSSRSWIFLAHVLRSECVHVKYLSCQRTSLA